MLQGIRGIAVAFGGLLILTTVWDAEAASARLRRCNIVSGPRVRIQIDGQGLAPGTYTARVRNLRTGKVAKTEVGKEQTATALAPDIDLDFDSTADPTDSDSVISATFVIPEDEIRVRIFNEANVVVARTTGVCRQR